MNKRNACFAGLAAAVTLLAGCAAQYRNPDACEEEMRNRLAKTTLGELKVTHSATTYRGTRVVIEGRLEHGAASAVAASSAYAAQAAQTASGAVYASSAAPVSAPQASAITAPSAVAAVVPGMMAVPSSPAVATGGGAQDTPTTPVAILAAKLGIRKHPVTAAAAECIFNESGLTAFRWLAPAALAKTTPAPNAAD
ncbi:MAG TPA: hypothetical protein VMJ11_19800 [Paraburkholderia sp.]|uniref:hypothetical protein n=1 Tax=Paraburkholderia sp. TaxID=1926495 RepID=UPI002BECD5D8|nr:hypothetical protein [Paraburkholderia sp.]HTR08849.1 hypothetical protein [Paraburkholderia sp.]